MLSINETRNDSGRTDYSIYLITVFSMVFTVISIVLSIIQHFSTNKFIKPQNIFVIKFNIESQDIQKLDDKKQFSNKIVFIKYNAIINCIAKILQIDDKQIERLKPLQNSKGAIFTFIIEKNISNNINKFNFIDTIKRHFIESIKTGQLLIEFNQIYEFKSVSIIPIESVLIKKLIDYNFNVAGSNKNAYASEKQMAEIIPEVTRIAGPNVSTSC